MDFCGFLYPLQISSFSSFASLYGCTNNAPGTVYTSRVNETKTYAYLPFSTCLVLYSIWSCLSPYPFPPIQNKPPSDFFDNYYLLTNKHRYICVSVLFHFTFWCDFHLLNRQVVYICSYLIVHKLTVPYFVSVASLKLV